MSTCTKRRHSPQGRHNITKKGQGNVYTQAQDGVVPGRRADGVDRPFPNKPVGHRRTLNPERQDALDLYDFEKITITKQPRGPLPPQEHDSNGIRETAGFQRPRKDSHRQPRGELQMAKAIHEKELILQEKLWSVEEKIRQKIQRDTAAGDDQRHEGQRINRGHAQTKTRLSEQQKREAEKSREMVLQERRQEDVKQLRMMPDQRNEDRRRNTHETERARWRGREVDFSQSQRNEQEANGELHKSRWENVEGHTRERAKKDNSICGETGVKSQDGTMKAKEREQNTTDDKRDTAQKNQQKTSQKAASENHRDAGRKPCGGQQRPPVSLPSHSNREEQEELRQDGDRDAGLQLLPCRVCNRKFSSERLQKHVQICKKVKQSHRTVFNSYVHRTKGSAIEEFWKTHSRPKSPEVLKKKNQRQNREANAKNLREGRLPAGTSQAKWSK